MSGRHCEIVDGGTAVMVCDLNSMNGTLVDGAAAPRALRKALKGLVVMSSELEAMGQSIFINAVPGVWEKKAYPSMKPYLNWCDDLFQRLQFVHDWVEHGIPPCFWISGFYFPQAFLTGTLQNFARKFQIPIDQTSFDFRVLTPSEEVASAMLRARDTARHCLAAVEQNERR